MWVFFEMGYLEHEHLVCEGWAIYIYVLGLQALENVWGFLFKLLQGL